MSKPHNKTKKANKLAGKSKGYIYNLEILKELDTLHSSGEFPYLSTYKIIAISNKAPFTATIESWHKTKGLNGKLSNSHFYEENIPFTVHLVKENGQFTHDLAIKVGDIVFCKTQLRKMRRELRDITGHKYMDYIDTPIKEIHAKIPTEKYSDYGLKPEMFEKPAGYDEEIAKYKLSKYALEEGASYKPKSKTPSPTKLALPNKLSLTRKSKTPSPKKVASPKGNSWENFMG
jgi:hypothetical protein